MEIQKIIDQLKKRNVEALSSLFQAYAAALNGIILRILPSEKLAEEVLNQTFFKIWNEIDQYDQSKSTLFTWMSQIARNIAIEHKRQQGDQNLFKNDTFKIEVDKEQLTPNIASFDTKALMEHLDEKHRMIIDYIYLRGYSQSQTAEVLQIPVDTVKASLRYGVIELRKILKDNKHLYLGVLSLITLLNTYLCL